MLCVCTKIYVCKTIQIRNVLEIEFSKLRYSIYIILYMYNDWRNEWVVDFDIIMET